MSKSVLTIGDFSVRQHDGLFSLNDLHAASGGEAKHQPALFIRLDQTQALLNELQKGGDSHLFLNTVKGRNGGTYVCRELVIAYAAWISAAFHLKVIRVFLDAQTAKPAQLPPPPPKRNVIRCKVESVAVTMRLTSGGVGFGIRLQGDHYNMHRFNPGEEVELEFAPGAKPLADSPIGVNRIK